jgi:hypothetical protein
MVTFNAHFDGKVIVPDEPLALKPHQRLRISVEPIESQPPAEKQTSPLQLGLQRGVVTHLSPDWDDPLPDDVWADNDPEDKP